MKNEIINQLSALRAVDWLIICTAIASYVPLLRAVYKDKEHGAGQNFCTWILWVALDVIQCICIILAHGTYVMFLAFIPCATIMNFLTFKYRRKMTSFEKRVAWLTGGCVIIWVVFGGMVAIVFETIAQAIAGFPLLKDTYTQTHKFKKTFWPLWGFVVVHLLSFFRVKGFSIEHTLFPAVMLVITLASIAPIMLLLYKERKIKSRLSE